MILSSVQDLIVVLAGAHASAALSLSADATDIATTGVLAASAPSGHDQSSNGTTPVTLVAAPAAGYVRSIGRISVYNSDTGSATVTVRRASAVQIKVVLQVGYTLDWRPEYGWRVLDTYGQETYVIGESVAARTSGSVAVAHSGGSSTTAAKAWDTTARISRVRVEVSVPFDGAAAGVVRCSGGSTLMTLTADFLSGADLRGLVIDDFADQLVDGSRSLEVAITSGTPTTGTLRATAYYDSPES